MNNIAILGSTGSIGQNALDIVRNFPDQFRVVGLSAHSNVGLLEKQIREFKPRMVCVSNPRLLSSVTGAAGTRIISGSEGLCTLCAAPRVDKVVMAISGADALSPLLTAIEHKKAIALANKESLVMAGPLVMRRAKERGVRIVPIDSEQSAIWQCICAEDKR